MKVKKAMASLLVTAEQRLLRMKPFTLVMILVLGFLHGPVLQLWLGSMPMETRSSGSVSVCADCGAEVRKVTLSDVSPYQIFVVDRGRAEPPSFRCTECGGNRSHVSRMSIVCGLSHSPYEELFRSSYWITWTFALCVLITPWLLARQKEVSKAQQAVRLQRPATWKL